MLTDRRPILLANARLIDPSRDFDGIGDVLIADGTIRESRRGIGAAGVPEGTDIVNCAGLIVAPGLVDMRAFIGEPGLTYRETFASASQAPATAKPLRPPARRRRPAASPPSSASPTPRP